MCSGEGGWSPWSHGPCSHTCGTGPEQAPRTAPLLTILTSALATAPSTKRGDCSCHSEYYLCCYMLATLLVYKFRVVPNYQDNRQQQQCNKSHASRKIWVGCCGCLLEQKHISTHMYSSSCPPCNKWLGMTAWLVHFASVCSFSYVDWAWAEQDI